MNRPRTILQSFEWYTSEDGSFWNQVKVAAPSFSSLGFTGIWLPPACKAAGGIHDTGYGIYDLYDLGEFDQKGTVRTKYGTREEYLAAVDALHRQGLKVLADIVLNQKMGADETEDILSVESTGNDRGHDAAPSGVIRAWTKFTFPGRNGKYDDFTWDHTCFDGTDFDASTNRTAIFRFSDKTWDSEVDSENGNYDYLMGCDLDMNSEKVRSELLKWGKWYFDTVGFDGVRLDAVKHICASFYEEWIREMREYAGRPLFAVGEYWNGDTGRLLEYLEKTADEMSLFDVPLHYRFLNAAQASGGFDMRTIFENTLVSSKPGQAVTFVDNHDTQPGQALSSFVPEWFKPLAYAMILLRTEGIPCVFAGDLYGIPHDGIAPVGQLPVLLQLRRDFAAGKEYDYLNDADVIGWYLMPDEKAQSAMAVVLSDGPGGTVRMQLPEGFAGRTFADALGACSETVSVSEDGTAEFRCEGGSVSVWIDSDLVSQYRK